MSDIASLFVWRRPGVLVAAITGEVDISNAQGLGDEILRELEREPAALVVDLAGLTFLDGAGVHLLFSLSDRLGHRFAVVLPDTSPPRRVLDLSGPRPRGWLHQTEEAAIEAVR